MNWKLSLVAVIAFGFGVVAMDTRTENLYVQQMNDMAAQCKEEKGPGARLVYEKRRFGCLFDSPTWAMAPILTHPLRPEQTK